MKKFLKEFKTFALKGNVMNLAVGVIIGVAFQGVVTSLTDNILSPLIGLFTRQNFDDKALEFLGVTLRCGAFLTSVINFLIMALVVFLLVRAMNRLIPEKKPEPELPKPKCPYCLTEVKVGATRCPACTSQLEGTVQS